MIHLQTSIVALALAGMGTAGAAGCTGFKARPLSAELVRSGHRRLRPVLMTSLAATLGMLPLAWGIGSGADMLRPLAIAVIGALCMSMLFSLIATPTVYFILQRRDSQAG